MDPIEHGRTIIQLDYPLVVDGEQITELAVRMPRVKHMMGLPKTGDQVEEDTHLYARLTGVNPEDLKELALPDMQKLNEVFQSFLSPPDQQTNGATPSSSSPKKPAGQSPK